MLNVNQDLLLLLTALSLKDERKSLKQVFVELENRGMYFDRYSREEIVKLLDKLNVLDKKSDSGDAQYVKPIL
jgi:DNA phosphorothioation-dependent restriction protein DptG